MGALHSRPECGGDVVDSASLQSLWPSTLATEGEGGKLKAGGKEGREGVRRRAPP